jgi:hypothetical protein
VTGLSPTIPSTGPAWSNDTNLGPTGKTPDPTDTGGHVDNCEICGDDGFVGVGIPARWVCLTHFNEWLAERAKVVALVKEAASG